MGRAGPRRVRSYRQEFKLRAVQPGRQPGVLVPRVIRERGASEYPIRSSGLEVKDADPRCVLLITTREYARVLEADAGS